MCRFFPTPRRFCLKPFRGLTGPASIWSGGKGWCIHIARDKGVCGAALREGRTMRVPDVHAFPGHIACDSASNSEIVIPIHTGGKTVAVLDIDSPSIGRFTDTDKAGLERYVKVLEKELGGQFEAHFMNNNQEG